MIIQLLLLIVLLPLTDLLLLLILTRFIGIGPALTLVIGSAVAGALLARRQWRQLKERAQQRLALNQIPGDLASEAVLILLTAGLLITPGLLTDFIGLSLLWPTCRRWYRNRILNWLKSSFKISIFSPTSQEWRDAGSSDILDGEYRTSEPFSQDSPPKLEKRS
jgi:UPF0716 protein FxsA